MDELISKAAILLEALPYIQRFRSQTFVVKYGGSFMDSPDAEERHRVARDIVFLESVGINPIVIHGGGKAITRALQDAGMKAEFVQGLRVTDAETRDIALPGGCIKVAIFSMCGGAPTITPIRANETAGVREAKTQAIVEGMTTVRVICHSLAPNRRAALTKPSSMERAPSKVLKNTRKTTTIQDVTTLDMSPRPNIRMMSGTSAIRGSEFNATM